MAVTKDSLLEYLRDKARVDTSSIEEETELFSTGLVDSFAMVDLLVFLEKNTGSKMGPEDISLDNLDTIKKIVEFAATKTK